MKDLRSSEEHVSKSQETGQESLKADRVLAKSSREGMLADKLKNRVVAKSSQVAMLVEDKPTTKRKEKAGTVATKRKVVKSNPGRVAATEPSHVQKEEVEVKLGAQQALGAVADKAHRFSVGVGSHDAADDAERTIVVQENQGHDDEVLGSIRIKMPEQLCADKRCEFQLEDVETGDTATSPRVAVSHIDETQKTAEELKVYSAAAENDRKEADVLIHQTGANGRFSAGWFAFCCHSAWRDDGATEGVALVKQQF